MSENKQIHPEYRDPRETSNRFHMSQPGCTNQNGFQMSDGKVEIRVGDRIASKNGKVWRIVCVDADGDQPIVGISGVYTCRFCADGRYLFRGRQHHSDLDLTDIGRPEKTADESILLRLRKISDRTDCRKLIALVTDRCGSDPAWTIVDLDNARDWKVLSLSQCHIKNALAEAESSFATPKPQLVPFTYADRKSLRGRIVRRKDATFQEVTLTEFNQYVANGIGWNVLLDDFVFDDTGEPVGKPA